MTLNLKSMAFVPYVDPFSEVRGVVLALIFKTRRHKFALHSQPFKAHCVKEGCYGPYFQNSEKEEEEERTNTRACSALRRRS